MGWAQNWHQAESRGARNSLSCWLRSAISLAPRDSLPLTVVIAAELWGCGLWGERLLFKIRSCWWCWVGVSPVSRSMMATTTRPVCWGCSAAQRWWGWLWTAHPAACGLISSPTPRTPARALSCSFPVSLSCIWVDNKSGFPWWGGGTLGPHLWRGLVCSNWLPA